MTNVDCGFELSIPDRPFGVP